MQKVDAKSLFEQARLALEGKQVPKNLEYAWMAFNKILDKNLGNPTLTYCLGSICFEQGWLGLAIQLLSLATEGDPTFGEGWNNLGNAYRANGMIDEARECFIKAATISPEISFIPSNIAGTYLNNGTPQAALEWAEKALKINPAEKQAKWHKALALLEMRQWAEGWDCHEVRLEGGANHNIADRNYSGDPLNPTPWWDGKSPGLVAVHGEQGLGDEIMFGSCISDMLKIPGVRVIFEPSPRSHTLFTRTFPDVSVHGTHKVNGVEWVAKEGRPDFKIAMGSLPKFFRRRDEDFPGTPFLKASDVKRRDYRDRLDKLGDKLKVGIAWQGGVESTAVYYRSLHLQQMLPILKNDATFVSLQYTPDAQENIAEFKAETGIEIVHWADAAQGKVLDDLVALIAELDIVISVCQTAIHIAGALGKECWVLTPSRPSWRYGIEGEKMPWYNSVSLFRQDGEWEPVIETVGEKLANYRRVPEAQRRVA